MGEKQVKEQQQTISLEHQVIERLGQKIGALTAQLEIAEFQRDYFIQELAKYQTQQETSGSAD